MHLSSNIHIPTFLTDQLSRLWTSTNYCYYRKAGDTWLVFFVTKSLWPQYHYLLPWDYRSGEYGTYENGCLNSILRVFAALGMASQLTTISSVGVKEALAKSAKTGEPLAGCLEESKYILPDILHQDPENY